MIQRTLTSIVLAVLALGLLACFPLPGVPQMTAMLLGCGAVWELLKACGVKSRGACALAFGYAILLPLLPGAGSRWSLLAALVLGMLFFTYLMTQIGKLSAPGKWLPVLSVGLTVWLFRALPEYAAAENGVMLLCLTGVICAMNDICAFLVGSRYGRHKLARRVSPGKTIEGGLGGLVITVTVITLTCSQLFPQTGWSRLAVFTALVSVLGQWGDLSMSAVKRVVGVKDFGHLLPGHGGILDRCDSLLYTLSFTRLIFGFQVLLF